MFDPARVSEVQIGERIRAVGTEVRFRAAPARDALIGWIGSGLKVAGYVAVIFSLDRSVAIAVGTVGAAALGLDALKHAHGHWMNPHSVTQILWTIAGVLALIGIGGH